MTVAIVAIAVAWAATIALAVTVAHQLEHRAHQLPRQATPQPPRTRPYIPAAPSKVSAN